MKYADMSAGPQTVEERAKMYCSNWLYLCCYTNTCKCGAEVIWDGKESTWAATWHRAKQSHLGGEPDALQTLPQS